MCEAERRRLAYLFKPRLTAGVKRVLQRAMQQTDWQNAGPAGRASGPRCGLLLRLDGGKIHQRGSPHRHDWPSPSIRGGQPRRAAWSSAVKVERAERLCSAPSLSVTAAPLLSIARLKIA